MQGIVSAGIQATAGHKNEAKSKLDHIWSKHVKHDIKDAMTQKSERFGPCNIKYLAGT